MLRAVLPYSSARAEWLLAGITDRALGRWACAPPLDGEGDQDAGSAIPDDDNDFDDIASTILITAALKPLVVLVCSQRQQLAPLF